MVDETTAPNAAGARAEQAPGSFARYLGEHVAAVDARMAAYFEHQGGNADLERYLYGPLAHFSSTGGKRVRPIICMLAARAVGGDPERARTVGEAIEHFQSAALIHDDIADNGQLRRGEPCLYRTQGTGLAINCGDMALVHVTQIILDDDGLGPAVKLEVLDELCRMMERTCEGQALDLGWVRDGRFDLSVDDYLEMATLKTAHYSGAVPLAAGAIAGGGSPEQVEALRSYGLDTGLAFQIQDDLINLVGSDTDKDFRCDITEGKRTLVAVHALENPLVHDEVEQILRSGTTDPALMARAVELFEQAGSIAYAHDYALARIARAKETLSGINLDPACRELLLSMADFFVERLK